MVNNKRKTTKKENLKNEKRTDYKLKKKALICCISILSCICLMAVGVWASKEIFDVEIENPISYLNETINDNGDVIRIVDGVIMIGSYDELNCISAKVNSNSKIGNSLSYYKNAVYHLDANIDCQNKTLNPIGTSEVSFSGVFLGKGFYIANFKIESNMDNVGLFGYTDNAGFYNINLTGNLSVSGEKNVGALIGFAKGTTNVYACMVEGLVSGKDGIGGVCGQFEENGIIEKCTNNASITNNLDGANIGGIVGLGSGIVASCTNNGNITFNSNNNKIGGIISTSTNLVTKCRNNGQITGSGSNCYIGGICAVTEDKVSNSFNTAELNMVGEITVGGISSINRGAVEKCYNIGMITSADSLGGIVGDNYGSINCCYNSGLIVSNASFCGGIVGRNLTEISKVVNCYNTESVSVVQNAYSPLDFGSYFGGIAGWNDGEVSMCYNISNVSAMVNVDGIVGYCSSLATLSNNYILNTLEISINSVIYDGYSNYIGNGVITKTKAEMTGIGALSNMNFDNTIWIERANDTNSCFLQLKCFTDSSEFDSVNINKIIYDSLQSVTE